MRSIKSNENSTRRSTNASRGMPRYVQPPDYVAGSSFASGRMQHLLDSPRALRTVSEPEGLMRTHLKGGKLRRAVSAARRRRIVSFSCGANHRPCSQGKRAYCVHPEESDERSRVAKSSAVSAENLFRSMARSLRPSVHCAIHTTRGAQCEHATKPVCRDTETRAV